MGMAQTRLNLVYFSFFLMFLLCVAETHNLESKFSLILIWEESILYSCHHFWVLTAVQVIITIIRIIIER